MPRTRQERSATSCGSGSPSDPKRRAYAINPKRATIGGEPAYPSIVDVPDDVALAVIAVPAATIAATIDECIAKRVRGAVIVTSVDDEPGIDMPALVTHARHHGMRIIGPGSFGIASPLPEVALQASLVEVPLPSGNVAISMQSGTLASAFLRLAAHLQLPTSWFVSLGDKADVSGNDLLQFWEDDEATGVIALYTESLGNPRKFARIARRVSRRRPIVSVRTGTALSGPATDALYADTGVIQVPTVTALLDTARTLATQPLMNGNRVAVVTNSPSPGVLATASLEAGGLEVVAPPLQLSWRSTADDYRQALSAALADEAIDAVVVIHAPPLVAAIGEPTEAIDAACAGAVKPVVAVMLGAGNGPLRPSSPIPSFAFPEPAAGVLARIAAYSAWRRTELERWRPACRAATARGRACRRAGRRSCRRRSSSIPSSCASYWRATRSRWRPACWWTPAMRSPPPTSSATRSPSRPACDAGSVARSKPASRSISPTPPPSSAP